MCRPGSILSALWMQCFHNRAVEGGTVSHKKRNHTWIVGLVAGVSVLVIVLVSGLAMLMYSKWKDNSTNGDKNILTNNLRMKEIQG